MRACASLPSASGPISPAAPMLSLSHSARLVAAERITAAAVKIAAAARAISTMQSSARVLVAAKPAASPLLSVVAAPAVSVRGLATRSGSRSSQKKKPASTRSASKSKSASASSGSKARSPSKPRASPRAASATRGARSTATKSKATQARKQAAMKKAAAAAQKRLVRQRRLDDLRATKAARRQSLRARKQVKLQKEKALRAARRSRTIAKNRTKREKIKTIEAKRRLTARLRASAQKTRARIEAEAKAKLAKQAAFNKKHPQKAAARQRAAKGLPAPPKRPGTVWSSYIKAHFSAERAAMTTAGSPAPHPTAVVKSLAQKFKAIPETEKNALQEEYARRRAEYEAQKKKDAQNLPPKRPNTPYVNYFIKQQKTVSQANPQMKVAEVSKAVAEAWKALPASEREAGKDQYEREVKAWKDALATWHTAHPGVQASAFVFRKKPSLQSIIAELKEQAKRRMTKDAAAAKKKRAANKKKNAAA